MTKNPLMILLATVMLLGSSLAAEAGTVTFDFNGLATGVGATGGVGTYGSIQNYMRSLLTGGATVSVSAGAVTDKAYNGDGHVVGPCSPGCTSVTLGPDTFVRNLSTAAGWSFTFSGLVIDSVQFDYEIFPDGTCTALTSASCGGAAVGGIYPNQPDFTFSTNLGTVFHYYGQTPGAVGGSTYTHSPISGSTATEKAPQLIGNTGLLNVGGATTLTFMDWPATIGIDNLVVNFRNPPVVNAVPEPGSMLLLGSGLAAAYARRRRRQNV